MLSTTNDAGNRFHTANSMNASKISSNNLNSHEVFPNFQNIQFDHSVNHDPIMTSHQLEASQNFIGNAQSSVLSYIRPLNIKALHDTDSSLITINSKVDQNILNPEEVNPMTAT